MARFLSARPRSITGLLLASFGLVAVPLVAAVVFAVVYVDRLTGQSERLILQGVEVTRTSRKLLNIITDMERNARQYAVLADPQLVKRFTENHRTFQHTLDDLAHLRLDTVATWKLDDLAEQGQEIADSIAADPPDQARLDAQLTKFEPLREQAKAISAEGNRFIDHEIGNLQQTSLQARRFLVLCVFALIPAIVILVLLFTVLISRPIHQIRAAIRQLGEGDFAQAVEISAPTAELDAIGSQLDWMRRRLADTESEKNQFLRQMSHELKTPLSSIREGVELMRDGALGEFSDKQSEVIEILQENSLELLALIENLLNFAAWQQHRSQLRYSLFELSGLLSEVLKRHSLTMERKHLHVLESYDSAQINADRDQIKLLVDNLLTNAIKFSPDGGHLYLEISTTNTHFTLHIADDGPGIAEEEREHIFNPFYQSALPERSHVQGTGIGLSVAREVARAHGGQVGVVNHKSALGACLQVSLPLDSENV